MIVYPASKRKAPPFKPLRPSKVPRIPTTESESSIKSKKITKPTAPVRKNPTVHKIDDESEPGSSDSDDLDEEPLPSKPSRPAKPTKTTAPRRNASRQSSPMSVSSHHSSNASPRRPTEPAQNLAPPLTQSDSEATIPQPLLVRLLHEHFADKTTKIDKRAIQVLQKYFEVFLRESIARAALRKKEDAEQVGDTAVDVNWLELEDLEKVAASMMLDF